MSPRDQPSRPPRILLHSHDSYGLGHLRRTLTIAGALAQRFVDAQVLITSGSGCATHFPLPPGVDVIKLPSVTKNAEGALVSRSLRADFESVVGLRQRMLLEIYRGFHPDLIVVDHQPVGLCGELLPVLRRAHEHGTRILLGMRDIVDSPASVAKEWNAPAVREALAHLFDRVLVYGVPEVFDAREEYPIPPELAARIEFVGYVVREGSAHGLRPVPSLRPQVLVTTGGGEDGEQRIQTYLDALDLAPLEWETTLFLGPLMDPERARSLKRRARLSEHVTVHSFHADLPRLLAESDVVVSMAGYNSVAEILQARVSAVLLPRTFPRQEQRIRAERLAALGLVRSLEDPTPATLRAAVDAALRDGSPRRAPPSMAGRGRVAETCAQLLDLPARTVGSPSALADDAVLS
jgi:predicted glycosyltransferase